MTAFLNAYSDGISGGDACFIEIAKRQNDWDLTIVTSAMGRDLCSTRGLDARFVILSRERAFRKPIPIYLARTLKGYARPRRGLAAEVYYATSDFLPDTLLAHRLRKRDPGSAWVQKIFHLIPGSRMIPHIAQKASLHLIQRSADLVIVDNRALEQAMLDRGFDAARVEVNYPGIDPAYFERLPAAASKLYDAAFLGRLAPSKGVFDLLPIWTHVLRRHPDTHLAVIGRGSPSVIEDMETRIRAQGLGDRIHLLGHLNDDQAFAVLKASRVFVFPSYEEGFGMAALEAIASGLPVVAYDLPVFSEVFPTGMLRVPVGDTERFAAATCELLDDGALAARLVGASDGLARQFDWARVASREAEAIARAVDHARHR